MGEQGSCAKANGVCLDDELRIDAARELAFGDSERNLSLAFVDDKHARVAYDDVLWSKKSAEEYMSMLMTYSAPLKMVIAPISRQTEFLETITVYPLDNDVGAFAKHRNRTWDLRHSYRIARGGVSGMQRVQSATATGTFMRILDNCTNECDAAIAITNEMHEMQSGAGMSYSQMTTALQKLANENPGNRNQDRKRSGFYKRFHSLIAKLRWW